MDEPVAKPEEKKEPPAINEPTDAEKYASYTGSYQNYGDVGLDLGRDWSRNLSLTAPAFIDHTIGHEGGKADLFKSSDPHKKHQFQWAAKEDRERINILRRNHYDWVKRSDWIKNPTIWEWDGEDYCWNNGQRAMARSEEFFIEEKHQQKLADDEARRRGRGRTQRDDDSDEFAARAGAKRGFEVSDENGRPLIPMKRTG